MVDPLEERCRAISADLARESARFLNSTLDSMFIFLNASRDCLRSADSQVANTGIEKALRAHDIVVHGILSRCYLIDSRTLRVIEVRLLELEAALQAFLPLAMSGYSY